MQWSMFALFLICLHFIDAIKTRAGTRSIEKNQLHRVRITQQSSKGDGVCLIDSRAVHVPNAIPGDDVTVKLLRVSKAKSFGKIVQLHEASSDRVTAVCAVADRCGGCQLQQQSMSAQLEFKTELVRSALQSYPQLAKVPVADIVPSQSMLNYRNKLQFAIQRNSSGHAVVGLYSTHSHRVVDTHECHLQYPATNAVLQRVRAFLMEYPVSVYDEERRTGSLRHLVVRAGFASGELMVCLVSATRNVKFLREFVDQVRQVPGVCSVLLNHNAAEKDEVLGSDTRILFGRDHINEQMAGVQVRVSLHSFVQSNPVQAATLYSVALSSAGLVLTHNCRLWDLYCGVGTIGLSVAARVHSVIGVEDNAQAVTDAEWNAKTNGAVNAAFFCGKAEEVLTSEMARNALIQRIHEQQQQTSGSISLLLSSQKQQQCQNNIDSNIRTKDLPIEDVVVLNPPRRGCQNGLLQFISTQRFARTVVYVSCSPSTMARDVASLVHSGFEVQRVTPVDQFPQTYHVETVVLLRRTD